MYCDGALITSTEFGGRPFHFPVLILAARAEEPDTVGVTNVLSVVERKEVAQQRDTDRWTAGDCDRDETQDDCGDLNWGLRLGGHGRCPTNPFSRPVASASSAIRRACSRRRRRCRPAGAPRARSRRRAGRYYAARSVSPRRIAGPPSPLSELVSSRSDAR